MSIRHDGNGGYYDAASDDEEENASDENEDSNEAFDDNGNGLVADEAEEVEEGEEDDDEEEEEGEFEDEGAETVEARPVYVPPPPVLYGATSKDFKKIRTDFAVQMIDQCVADPDWESMEIAKLVILCCSQLEIDGPEKLIKFLDRLEFIPAELLASLFDVDGGRDHFKFELSPAQSFGLLTKAGSYSHGGEFMQIISQGLEMHVFNAEKPTEETIRVLIDGMPTYFGTEEELQYAALICSFSKTKKSCAKWLEAFTRDLQESEAINFIDNVISLDFFLDLEGSMSSFYKQLPEIRQQLESFIQQNHHTNADGDIVESDEDEHGNLRDFVVDDEEEDRGDDNYNDDEEDEDEDEDEDDDDGEGGKEDDEDGEEEDEEDGNSGGGLVQEKESGVRRGRDASGGGNSKPIKRRKNLIVDDDEEED